MCKVSVIIYVKNSVEYIEQCMRSVMGQTLKDLEIIVSDGDSTDGTVEIIAKLCTEDHRIVFLQGAHGVGAQFNQSLRHAKGEYIGICEADDFVKPDMYECLYDLASANDCDVVKSGYYKTFSENGEQQFLPSPDMTASIKRGQVIVSDGDKGFLNCWIWHIWSGIYGRNFLLENNIFMNETEGASHQDITFQFLVQLYAKRLFVTDDHYYCYRLDNPQASMNGKNSIDKHAREYDLLKDELKNRGLWDNYNDCYQEWEYESYRLFYKLLNDRSDEAEHIAKILDDQAVQEGFPGDVDFIPIIIENAKETDRMLEYFRKEKYLRNPPVVFGMGHLGILIAQYLTEKDILPILADNDVSKQKNGYQGNRIYDIKTIAGDYDGKSVVVANTRFSKEMKEQLLSYGVPEGNIYICDDEDIFIRKIRIGTA